MKANARGKAFEVYDRLKAESNSSAPDLVIGSFPPQFVIHRL